jgi:predicted permease
MSAEVRMLLTNLRQALLRLLHAPLFTIIAVLTLTLGIGANTAIFSVIQGVLLHPAGVADPVSLVSFHARYTQLNLPSIGVSAPDQADAASLSSLASSSAMYQEQSFNAQQDGRTLHLLAAQITWPWFRTFGAEPILGRTFQPDDDQKGAARVVVVSYSAWQRLFGGQHDAVGKSLVLDGQPYRVIGVMRSDFDWPRSRDVWVPLGLPPTAYAADQRYNEFYSSVVRLRPGVSVAQFNAAIDQKHREQIRREGSGSFGQSAGWSMFAEPWTNDAAGDLRKPLIALFAVVAGVLLIACLNVAGLFLARASARSRELALRIALGASRSHIASLFISEVLLLAGIATILGIFSGPLLGRLILRAIPHDLAAGFSVHTDFRLVLAAAAIGLLSAVCAGMAPVWNVLRQRRTLRLAEGVRTTTGASGKQRLRAILVASEMAIAFLLVAGTGMFLSSLLRLQQVDPGFHPAGVMTGSVTLTAAQYRDNDTRRVVFVDDVLNRLRREPGVKDAGAVFPLPFGTTVKPSGSFSIENLPTLPNEPGPHADKRWATPGFLAAMQIPLLRGRFFTSSDTATTQRVAVIDDVLANAYWPHQDPIGQRLRFGSREQWAEIVGIVAHTRRDSLEVDENKGVVYTAFAQQPVEGATFIARSSGSAESLRTAMTDAVHAADGAEALYDVTPLSALVDASLAPRHLLVWMLSLFGGLALFLAAIGIYGLLSFLATQRTVEVGVRMALGANRVDIAYLIARRILPLLASGLGVGLILVVIAQRTLTHFFAAMSGGSISSIAGAAIVLLLAAMVAALLPALRAARLQPSVALRNE